MILMVLIATLNMMAKFYSQLYNKSLLLQFHLD